MRKFTTRSSSEALAVPVEVVRNPIRKRVIILLLMTPMILLFVVYISVSDAIWLESSVTLMKDKLILLNWSGMNRMEIANSFHWHNEVLLENTTDSYTSIVRSGQFSVNPAHRLKNSTETLSFALKGMMFENSLLGSSRLYNRGDVIDHFFDKSTSSEFGTYYELINYIETMRSNGKYNDEYIADLKAVVLADIKEIDDDLMTYFDDILDST
jgi:hypothetical protein